MPGAHQIHPDRLPGADEIAQRLLLGPRHPDRLQLAREQQPDEVLSVTTIGFHPLPRGILLGYGLARELVRRGVECVVAAQLTLQEHRREHHEGVAGDPGKQAAERVERNTRHIRILTEPLSGELDVGVGPDVLTERRFHGAREPLGLLGLIGVASPELALDEVQQMPELVNREIDESPRRFEPRIGHDHRNGRTQDATASTEIHRAICLLMLWSLARLVRDGARPQRPSPPGQAITEEGRRGRGPSGRSRTAASLTSTFLPGPRPNRRDCNGDVAITACTGAGVLSAVGRPCRSGWSATWRRFGRAAAAVRGLPARSP
jgi:hypothetical protein